MKYNTDGNLAALRAYEREQDALDAADMALDEARQEFSNDLFDAYFGKNYAVIDEVEELAAEEDAINNLLKKLRDAYPSASGVTCAYRDFIAAICDEIAERAEDFAAVDNHRRDYGL